MLTLYAAWVPGFTYEFYSVDENGNVTLLGNKDMNPMEDTSITLPAFDETTGGIDVNDFPYLSNNTYSNIYSDAECTTEISTETIVHNGIFHPENATVENTTMKVYCKLLDGVHFTITSAEQLSKNAYLNGVYTLEADLDFSDVHWPALFTTGNFSGKIIGNGHTIKNVTVEQTDNSQTSFGLFGQLVEGAQIKNVTFSNITVNVKAGSRLNEPNFGIIAGVAGKDTLTSVKLTSSKIVIYTKLNVSGTIVAPQYGVVCGFGPVTGVDFSNWGTVEFSSFDDIASIEQVEYTYEIDLEGRFKLSLKES